MSLPFFGERRRTFSRDVFVCVGCQPTSCYHVGAPGHSPQRCLRSTLRHPSPDTSPLELIFRPLARRSLLIGNRLILWWRLLGGCISELSSATAARVGIPCVVSSPHKSLRLVVCAQDRPRHVVCIWQSCIDDESSWPFARACNRRNLERMSCGWHAMSVGLGAKSHSLCVGSSSGPTPKTKQSSERRGPCEVWDRSSSMQQAREVVEHIAPEHKNTIDMLGANRHNTSGWEVRACLAEPCVREASAFAHSGYSMSISN